MPDPVLDVVPELLIVIVLRVVLGRVLDPVFDFEEVSEFVHVPYLALQPVPQYADVLPLILVSLGIKSDTY